MTDFYECLGAILRAQLENHEIDPEQVGGIIKGTTEQIAAQHGGQTVYLKNLFTERTAALHKQIADEREGGASWDTLSRKYRKSQPWIKKAVQRAAQQTEE